MDPATTDRRTTWISVLDERALPLRRMTIAGIEGGLDARILSKDMSGPATRLVTFPEGWGSGIPGAFTTSIEVLLLSGELGIGGYALAAHDYAVVPGGGIIPGLRARKPGRALLMTAAPVRYDTVSGGGAAAVTVARSGEIAWRPQPGHPGRFIKQLRVGPDGAAWLSGSLEWSQRGGPWHRHPVSEECFVIDGEITLVDQSVDGAATTHTYGPGGYVWRPAGLLHAGPGSGAPDAALTFHRVSGGPLETEWVGEEAAPGGL